jgi:hypothetical protein
LSGLNIHSALTLIHTSMGEFSLSFLKVDGSRRVYKPRVRIGTAPNRARKGKSNEAAPVDALGKRDWNHNINKAHNLLLFDLEKNRPFELKICLLMAFNQIEIDWHGPKK